MSKLEKSIKAKISNLMQKIRSVLFRTNSNDYDELAPTYEQYIKRQQYGGISTLVDPSKLNRGRGNAGTTGAVTVAVTPRPVKPVSNRRELTFA